jgi:hypothetical protein
MKLKYLFTAEYTDGTSFSQTEEDVSSLDPKRNCFYDVLNSNKKIKKFTLKEQTLWNPHTYSVDLLTGEFEIDGNRFMVEGQEQLPGLGEFRLVYTMRVQKHFNASYSTKSGALIKTEPAGETRRWIIGWQTTINGKNYQSVIGII